MKPQPPVPPTPGAFQGTDSAGKQPRNVPTLTEVVAPLARPAPAGRPDDRADPLWSRSPGPGRLTPIAAAAASAPADSFAEAQADSPDSSPTRPPAILSSRAWAPPSPLAPATAAAPKPDALAMLGQRVTMQVLLDMQRRTDTLLEQRLQQALEPALTRFAEQLKAEVRLEMARALREMVQVAVAQEIHRHRDKGQG